MSKVTGPIALTALADEPTVTRVGYDTAEYDKIVLSSWEKVQAGSQTPAVGVTLPAEVVATARFRFMDAGRRLKLGVGFNEHTHDSTRGRQLGLQPGQVRLVIEAKPRKVMAARTEAQKAASAAKRAATRAAKTGKAPAPVQNATKRQGLPQPR